MPPQKKKVPTKKKTTQRRATTSRKKISEEDYTSAEVQRLAEMMQIWDSDTEFFHSWCEEMDVLLYLEELERIEARQRFYGALALGFTTATIVGSFTLAVLSRLLV